MASNSFIPGVTGDLVWSDTYKTRVGSYPVKCLPSAYTLYYSAFSYRPSTQPYQDIPGGTPFISGFTSAVFPMGLPSGSVQKWQTTHRHIFANASYNINEPVILTQAMIDSNEITLPNYIFEIISVTPEPVDIPPLVVGPDSAKLDVFEVDHGAEYKIQFSLALDSSYLVKTSAVWSSTVSNNNISLDSETGILTIKVGNGTDVTIPTATQKIPITATNSMGSNTKTFTLEVVSGSNPTFEVSSVTESDNDSLLDKAWKSLFTNKELITENKLKELLKNQIGMYYRLDNGTDKAIEISKQSGYSYTSNHNDASSKKISVDLSGFKKDDIVYATYCAVNEHYLRQVVSISWFAIDMGYLGFVAYPTELMASNFRFYKWKMPGEKDKPEVEVEGWRCVETFNMNPNIISVDPSYMEGEVGFLFGQKGLGEITANYLPLESTYNQVNEIIKTGVENKLLISSYIVNQDQILNGHGYVQMVDRTSKGLPLEEVWANQSWYTEYLSRTSRLLYSNMIEYCVFNMHPTALVKRDVDKFAYPSDLANIIYNNLKKGEEVSIANFDTVDDPLNSQEFDALDLSNFVIDPIDSSPQIINLANASGTSTQIGLFPGVQGGEGILFGEFASNIIKEPMKKGTRILVETKPLASRGSVILSLKCQGSPKGFVDCILGKNNEDILLFSNNNDGFLSVRKMKNSQFDNDVEQLYFVPEKGGIDYNNPKTEIDSYPVIGISGLLGEGSGVYPCNTVSFAQYAPADSFVEYFYNKEQYSDFITKQEIGATTTGSFILIQLGRSAYTGKLKIECEANLLDDKKGVNALVLFSSSNKIEAALDNIPIPVGRETQDNEANKVEQTIRLDYLWLKGDTIKVSLDNLNVTKIKSISILGLQEKYSKDFLDFASTTKDITSDFKVYDGALFAKTDFSSSYIDERGYIYSFFEDTNGGISAVNSGDNGTTYNFQYNIIPKIEELDIRKPFITQSSISDSSFLFVSMNESIYVFNLALSDFSFEDAFKIKDKVETDDAFWDRIRKTRLCIAAGNNNKTNIEFILKNKDRLTVSFRTRFANIPITTPYFSAYQCNNGELRLSFLDENGLWQCNYSFDNGITWIDLWACMELCGPEIAEKYKTGEDSSKYPFGIKIHPDSDSIPESLYIHLSSVYNRIYLFYIYKGCLLCKIVANPNCPFGTCKDDSGTTDYSIYKKSVEEAQSYFIDGNIDNIKSEIGKNVLLKYKGTEGSFTEYRTISAQRVCAHQMPNGYLRVYYKTANDNAIRSAHLVGTVWAIDDMMYPTGGKIPDKTLVEASKING